MEVNSIRVFIQCHCNHKLNYVVPAETAKVAHAIFPKGNLCITMADRLNPFFWDQDFSTLFSSQGQPAVSPLRLALVTILQYVEGLTDRQAADAARSRIDWKYLLCLELTDRGFHHTVLSGAGDAPPPVNFALA